jgi:hypothetical protein
VRRKRIEKERIERERERRKKLTLVKFSTSHANRSSVT